MFIAVLFTVAKTQKQPKCPTAEEWIKKVWYICTLDYCSAIKKNETMQFTATWMDLDIVMLSELTRPGKGISIEEVSNHQETLALAGLGEVFPPNWEEKLNKAHRLRA